MPYDGSTWNETEPTNSTLANEIDDVARDIKIGVRGRMANEHIWPASQTGTSAAGYHATLSLQYQTGAPSVPVVNGSTQSGVIFATSGGSPFAFAESNGTVTAIIPGPTDTGGLVPAGATIPYAGASTPTGWLLCTGGAFSRTTYARLFNAIGTVHGTGDGVSTFNVPNLAGFTVVAKSAAGMFATLGSTTGATTHTLTIAEMPAHTHTVTALSGAAGSGASGGDTGDKNTSSVGGGGAHNNVQPSYVLNYIIKF